jgi:hypothetical protein
MSLTSYPTLTFQFRPTRSRENSWSAKTKSTWPAFLSACALQGVVFAVDLPEEAVTAYEREAGEEGRRFLMPAELLNRYGPPVAEGDWSE